MENSILSCGDISTIKYENIYVDMIDKLFVNYIIKETCNLVPRLKRNASFSVHCFVLELNCGLRNF